MITPAHNHDEMKLSMDEIDGALSAKSQFSTCPTTQAKASSNFKKHSHYLSNLSSPFLPILSLLMK
jgi:hypothetical protein